MPFQGIRDHAAMWAEGIHLAGPAQAAVEKAQDVGGWAWDHKGRTALALGILWCGVSYEKSPGPNILPTPTRTVTWSVGQADAWLDDTGDGNNEAGSPPLSTDAENPEDEDSGSDETAGPTATEAAVPADTVPSFSDDGEAVTATAPVEDAAATPTTATTAAPVVTATTVAASPGETILFSSGSMYCFKIIGGVVIGADEYAYEAIARASEEPLDDIDDSTGMATQVWEDIQDKLNGGFVENAPGVTMTVPDECHNYPRTDGSFVN
jgi:hypothetical protein